MKITYSVLFASLLFLAWPPIGFNAFLFIAFIPAFYLVDACFQKTIAETKKKFSNSLFYFCYIGFAIFNLASSYWIWNASAVGMIIAVLLNAFLMTLPFIFYKKMLQITSQKTALLAFIAAWVSMEYFHMHWDLSWPWFTLGNAFASSSTWVQWYEYTGVFGGSIWVLAVNAMLYLALQQAEWKNTNLKVFVPALLLILLPIIVSKIIYFNYIEQINPCHVVVVQPNIDPYNEKFSASNENEQMQKLLQLSAASAKKIRNLLFGQKPL